MTRAIGLPRLRISHAFALLVTSFTVLFVAVAVLLWHDQQQAHAATERLLQQTLPEIVRNRQVVRNLEKIHQEGERFFALGSPQESQQALFVVMVVANHPSIREHDHAAGLAQEVEHFLSQASLQAQQDPRGLKSSYPAWHALSQRLSLLVDDLSVHGVKLASADLGHMSQSMQTARTALVVALVLVGAFLLLLSLMLSRFLITPLQRIDSKLSTLRVDQPAPVYPITRLVEIHSIEEATQRLHSSLQELEHARHQLETLAHFDAMTGLYNRHHFMERATVELRRAQRYAHPICVGMADLDHFKAVNDNHGHSAGDVALKHFARLLRETLRQTDLVCRYGGEEFAFVCPESSLAEACAMAERLCQCFASQAIELPDGTHLQVTVSIGIASVDRHTLEQALSQADEALYQAKRTGRNRVVSAPT